MNASEPDLGPARASVLATIAGSPLSMRPPTANAAGPLTSLPPAVEAKLVARRQAGFTAIGTDHPRSELWQQAVLPAGTLAAVDAIGTAVVAALGHPVLTVVGIVVFLALLTATVVVGRRAGRDPLRLTARDHRAITDAGRWSSREVWAGPLSSSAERGLVVAAAQAAERIASSPSWRTGEVDHRRFSLDLAAELTQIDDQAHRIAVARHRAGPDVAAGLPVAGGSPVVDAAWESLLNRVAALTAYADQLDGTERRRLERRHHEGDPVRDSDLMAGSARDEMASDQLAALTVFLSAQNGDPLDFGYPNYEV